MRAWRNAALLALDSGFDICEVHGAHGYLIHQFLSPAVNKRTDAYGGDLAGRMRFVLEVLETVRSVWPKDKPLFFRVSATDGASGSWDLPDTIVLAKEAKLRGVDVVDCSSGGISGSPTVSSAPRPPGYQVPFAEQIRREAAIMTMAVGLITEASQAEAILQHGQADLIALGRQMLYDPHWAAHAAEALGVKDCFDYLPACQSWWLKRWEKQGV
jgi:2,4-dienoyl-CoA reductase-like NADH-dependent reductase (Old Yellow Enzyme family)